MRLARLFCSVLLYCLAEARFRPPNDLGGDSLADVLRQVLRASRTRDVLLMLRDESPDSRGSDILGKISAATARRVPTFHVNASAVEPEFQVSSCALSRDLLVYIYASQREPDIVESELIADDLKSLVLAYDRPKVLVLMALRHPSRDLAAFFRTMWSGRILNVIVVEDSGPDGDSREQRFTTVHRYDPFTNVLAAEPYSAATTEWFATDFPDMQGYRLALSFLRRPPYSDVAWSGSEKTLKGADWTATQTLAGKMNFSDAMEVLKNNIYLQTWLNGSNSGILPDLTQRKYEALFTTLPLFVDDNVQFSDTVVVERWCFVVPRLPARHNYMAFHGTGVRLFFTSFSIVGIFWLCAKFLRLSPGRWHPLRIFGIMLTSSFPPAPSKLHERIVFLSIFVACARYSSSLFAELMSFSFEGERYVRFDRLSDLVHSDLTLMMYPEMIDIVVDIIAQEDEGHVLNVEEKFMTIMRTDDCLDALLAHQNVSCFMEQGWAKLAAVNNMRDGESILRTTELCYLSRPTGYIFPIGSPYVSRVSELLTKLAEGGFRDKWQRDYLRAETRETSRDEEVVYRARLNFTYVSVFRPLLFVLQLGYSLSAVVFLGELVWKRLHPYGNFPKIPKLV